VRRSRSSCVRSRPAPAPAGPPPPRARRRAPRTPAASPLPPRARPRAPGGGWRGLACAVAAKLSALVLLPLAVVWTLRRRGGAELWRGLAIFAVTVLAVFGPF